MQDTQLLPTDEDLNISPNKRIKIEHNTEYSQYDDVVKEIPYNGADIIVIEDDEDNMFDDIFQETPNEIEVPVPSTSTASFKHPSNILRPIIPCTLQRQWKGAPIRSSSIVIEDFSDDDDSQSPVPGKKFLQSPIKRSVLSQNNSLFYSSQLATLLERAQNATAPSPNRLTRTPLPWFTLCHFSYVQGDENVDKFLVKIRIPKETDIVEITHANSIRLLFDLYPRQFSALLTLIKFHGKSYTFDQHVIAKGPNMRHVTLNQFFKRLLRDHKPRSNVTLERIIDVNNKTVEAKIVQSQQQSQTPDFAAAFHPDVLEAIQDLSKNVL